MVDMYNMFVAWHQCAYKLSRFNRYVYIKSKKLHLKWQELGTQVQYHAFI